MAVKYKASNRDTQIINDITGQIMQTLAAWYGSASELISSTPEILSYTNSFLLRYEVKTLADNKTILVKIRRNPKMDSLVQAITAGEIHANIPDEYNTLKFVSERIGDGHASFAAIRPLVYIEEYYAIVMEEFAARSIRQLLFEHRKSTEARELLSATRKAGGLLRFFHERVHAITDHPFSGSEFLSDVGTYAKRLEDYTRGRVNAQSILAAFGKKLAVKELQSMPFSAAHQDLTSDNVLYAKNGKVCLIDIKTKNAPIYSDLALLLVHPETFRDQIFRNGRFFSPAFLKSYRDAILAGYFGDQPVNRFLVQLFCAYRVLDKWTMHEELFSRYKGLKRVFTRPLSPILTSYFRELLHRYLDEAT